MVTLDQVRGCQKVSDTIRQFDKLCEAAMAAYSEELDVSYEESLLQILQKNGVRP
ncbi:hypothetical protein PFUM301598_56840 [Pseudomonas fluorescens]